MINIVVFGPIHSGKTSLMGYIRATCMQEAERIKEDRQIRKDLINKGVPYKFQDKFTYYISTDRDEIITDPGQSSIGTTKRMHIRNINHVSNKDVEADLIFIDTPGQNTVKMWKHRYEGIFMGDIGVFVIDINEIINMADLNRESDEYTNTFNKLFSYLFLWKTTKDMKDLIIVLSKIDTLISDYDILYAIETIREIDYFKDIPIIPIGIDFEKEKDYNIFSCYKITNTLHDVTFINKLFELLDEKLASDRKKDICFAYLKGTRKISETDETVLQIKVLEGYISQENKIALLPIKRNNSSEFDKAICSVKSMKLEDRKLVDCMVASNIGSILPSKIMIDNKRINLNELSIVKTTCIVGENTPYITGNLLSFKTKLYDKSVFAENFMKIRINQAINIVWFGKVLTASFCSKYINNDICYFNAYLQHYPIVMPIDNQKKYSITKFALEVNNSYFFQAELEAINNLDKDTDKIYFSFNKKTIDLSKTEIANILDVNIEERGGNYEAWVDFQNTNFKKINKKFGKFISKYKIDNYVFIVIGSDGIVQDCIDWKEEN